jgi:hypothetical protein
MYWQRQRDPAYFDASGYCVKHGTYSCIPCQMEPPTLEAQEAEAKAALAESRQVAAETLNAELSRRLAAAELPRRSILSKLGRKGGKR